MEHYNYARLWRLNTPEQRDLLVVRLFVSGNISTFVEWLADGLPLNAFMLSELALCHAYGEDKQYQEIILTANVFEDNAKLWLEEFLPPKTLLNLLEQKPELVSETFPSNDFCVKQELWDILMERKAYDAIAPVNPDLLSSCEDNAALSALLKVNAEKYINLAFERGFYNLVLSCKDGWKYLIDFGQAEWLFKNKCVMNIGLISEAEVAEYCYQKGLIDLLYKYGYYSKLLDHEEFEICSIDSTGNGHNDDRVDPGMFLKGFHGVDNNRFIVHMNKLFGNILVHPCAGSRRSQKSNRHSCLLLFLMN